jgi:hypothetical protein
MTEPEGGVDGFARATAVRRIDASRWDAQLVEGWDILGKTNGGYMLAIAARASSEAVGGRSPVSITGHFTRPGVAGPATVVTSVVREGRQMAVVRATLIQRDRIIVETLGLFRTPSDNDPETVMSDASPPPLPPVDKSPRVRANPEGPFPPPSVDRIDLRPSPSVTAFFTSGETGDARVSGWFNLLDDEPLDPYAQIVACDAFPPTAFVAGLPIGWTPTIEMTIHIRDPRAMGWLRCDFTSRFVSGGYIEEDGLVWSADGMLVAQSRQLALVSR